MKIGIACDHAGYPLKKMTIEVVRSCGDEPVDLGTNSELSVDYPDFAEKTGRLIQGGQIDRGIILCGSGVGASIAANKMKGVYAGVCHDTYSAHQSVEHDAINVLCIGARIIGSELAREIIRSFLKASFSGEERHLKRVEKIKRLETEK